MHKHILIWLSFFLIFQISIAQDTYVRPGVSIVNIDFNNSRSNLNTSSIEIPKNFDFLNISKFNFTVQTQAPKKKLPSEIENAENPLAGLKKEAKSSISERNNIVVESFIANKISNSAVLAAVPIGDDGSYNYDNALSRGVNSATDQDANLTSQEMIGIEGSIEDRYLNVTEKVLNNNYVIGFNMPRFSSYSNESSRGLEGVIHYFVFKIDNVYSSELGGLIYNESEINEVKVGSSIIAFKSFTSTATNSKDQSTNKALGIEPKSNEELAIELQKALFTKVWDFNLRQVDEFKPKTTLMPKNKISLGLKENLKIDNRFFLYENVQNKAGEIVKKKRATMRVKNVGANEGIATGNSDLSKLYKIGYGRSEEGMLVVQEEDLGIGLSFGYGSLSWIRFDYRVKGILPGFLVFIDLHPYPGKLEFNDYFYNAGLVGLIGSDGGWELNDDISSFGFNLSLGLEKQTYFTSAFYISPFISGGISNYSLTGEIATKNESDPLTSLFLDEKMEWSVDESNIYNSYFISGGLRLGIQITSSASINLSLAHSSIVYGGWQDAKVVYSLNDQELANGWNIGDPSALGLSEETDKEYLDAFYNTSIKELPTVPVGLQYNLMLRYEF